MTAIRYRRRAIFLLALCVFCLPLLWGCAANEAAPSTDGPEPTAEHVWETNQGEHAVTYPWVIHTPSAVWYLAAADVELLGEETFREGLELVLTAAEADFADARAALGSRLPEEVPPIDIYTDFAGRTEHARVGVYDAYYFGSFNCIYLCRDWETAACSLLHEYVHYLSFRHCDFSLREGFWAEGLADYVSMLVCENRMARSVGYGFDEQTRAFLQEHGAAGPDGEPDVRLMYLGSAAVLHTEAAVGQMYASVSKSPMPMTERQQQHPLMTACSYYEAACFVEYLVEQYGAELVFSHLDCEQGDMESVYGKDFETLFFQWRDAAFARCAELGLVIE